MDGFIVEISGEDMDTLYVSNTGTVPSINQAAFFTDRSLAKYAAKDFVTQFVDGDITVRPATITVTAR